MRIKDMSWMQVEDYLKRDDRAVLPIGSTEQHAQLSLMVDCILSERVAVDAAEPTGVPVFPPVNYGITPYFRAFPGSVSLRMETFLRVIEDILDSLLEQGFRKVLIVNGHGGNSPAQTLAQQWMTDNPGTRVQISQLVQRAQDLGQGQGNRSRRLPCLMDGEFPLDAPQGCRHADAAEADGGFRQGAGQQRQGDPGETRRREFRRLLRET